MMIFTSNNRNCNGHWDEGHGRYLWRTYIIYEYKENYLLVYFSLQLFIIQLFHQLIHIAYIQVTKIMQSQIDRHYKCTKFLSISTEFSSYKL